MTRKLAWLRRPMPAWLLLVLVIGSAVGTTVFLASNLRTSPDFTMTTSSTPETVLAQGDPSSHHIIRVAPVNNFAGIVSITVFSPTGIKARLNPTSSTGSDITTSQVLLGQDQSLNLTITASSPGNYSVVVTGNSGWLTHSVTVKVIARGLGFNVNPNPVSVTPCYAAPCSSGNSTVTFTSQNGLGGNMTLFYLSNNSGVGASGPAGIVVAPGRTTTFTIAAFLTPTLPPPTPPHGGSVRVVVETPLGPTSFLLNVIPA